MADLSPDVKKLLATSETLYEALKRSKPTQNLAIAIRDNIPFGKLQDAEILVMCAFSKEIEKLAKVAEGAQQAAAAEGSKPITPDSVEPPAGKGGDKKPDRKKGDSAS